MTPHKPNTGFVIVQSLKGVRLFAAPRTATHQASLPFTLSKSLLKFISIESVMPSNHLILCLPFSYPQSFPAAGSFPVSQFFTSGGQSIGVSASATVLPMNIQDWFPLRLTGLMSLQSKGLSGVFSNTTVERKVNRRRRKAHKVHGEHSEEVRPWPRAEKCCAF